MKYSVIALSLLFVFASCKKEKLEGDYAILIGNWDWTHTNKLTNACDDSTLWNIVQDDTTEEGSTYSLLFEEKGIVTFNHNGGKINHNRIVLESIDPLSATYLPFEYNFYLKLNNKDDKVMAGLVGANNLMIYDFPKDTDNSCETMYNYFVKE